MGTEETPQNTGQPDELVGVTHEDIIAAVAILREDQVIKAGRESAAAVKALEERYAKDREEDAAWRKKWEEAQPKTPENDSDPKAPGVPEPPALVPANAPVGDGGTVKEKKRKGLWFREEEETS